MNTFEIFAKIGPFLLPILFTIHDLEEVAFQHKWMLRNEKKLKSRFPKVEKMVDHLLSLSTKKFAIAAAEELFIILLVIAASFLPNMGLYVLYVWISLFIGFGLHLLIHVGQALLFCNYVPGLFTSIISTPFIYIYANQLETAGIALGTQLLLGLIGLVIIAYNLSFAHWLGKKLG